MPCPQSNRIGKPSNCIRALEARRSNSIWHVPVPSRVILLIGEIFSRLVRILVSDEIACRFVNYAFVYGQLSINDKEVCRASQIPTPKKSKRACCRFGATAPNRQNALY